MKKQLVKREGEFSYYLFTPDLIHLYDYNAEKTGREEPVHRYTVSHIIHQLLYLIIGGYSIFYMEMNGEIVSYAVYTKCSRFVFDSGNPEDYYVIFYYTYPEYRGKGFSTVLMNALFASIKGESNFYECISKTNYALISAAGKIGFSFDGFVSKKGCLHTLIRTDKEDVLLYKYHKN